MLTHQLLECYFTITISSRIANCLFQAAKLAANFANLVLGGYEPLSNPCKTFMVQPHFFSKKNTSKGPIDSKILVDQNLEVLVICIC